MSGDSRCHARCETANGRSAVYKAEFNGEVCEKLIGVRGRQRNLLIDAPAALPPKTSALSSVKKTCLASSHILESRFLTSTDPTSRRAAFTLPFPSIEQEDGLIIPTRCTCSRSLEFY